jgi:hypothetical protein
LPTGYDVNTGYLLGNAEPKDLQQIRQTKTKIIENGG